MTQAIEVAVKAVPAVAAGQTAREFLTFRLGEEEYGIDMELMDTVH